MKEVKQRFPFLGNNEICKYLSIFLVNIFLAGIILTVYIAKTVGQLWHDETKDVKNRFKVISPSVFRLPFQKCTFTDIVFALSQENC
jgi:hypothetical protein